MVDKSKQPIRLRDEFFDEILNGRPTIETEVAQEQVLLKEGEEEKKKPTEDDNEQVISKKEDKPSKDIVTPQMKSRLQDAGKVAFSSDSAKEWVNLSFGEFIRSKATETTQRNKYLQMIKDKKDAIMEHHNKFSKNSLRGVLNKFLRIRAIFNIIKDIVEIGKRITKYIDDTKPKGMTTFEYIKFVLEDKERTKDFFKGLFNVIVDPLEDILVQSAKVILVPVVTTVWDIGKEIMLELLKQLGLVIARFVMSKIPGAGQIAQKMSQNSIVRAIKSISAFIKRAMQGIIKAISVPMKVVGKAAKATTKTAAKGAKTLAKVADNAVVKTGGKVVAAVGKYGWKGVKFVSTKTFKYGQRVVRATINGVVDTVKEKYQKVKQNAFEIVAMGRMARDMAEDIANASGVFFSSFIRNTSVGDIPLKLANIIESIADASIDNTLESLASISFHEPDFGSLKQDEKDPNTYHVEVDATGSGALWSRLLVSLFHQVQTYTAAYFNEMFFNGDDASKVFSVPEKQSPQTQYEIIEGDIKERKRYITLSTKVKSSVISDGDITLDYTNITGFDVSIVNGEEVYSFNEDILGDTKDMLFSQQDIDDFKDNKKFTDSDNTAGAEIDQFQQATLTLEKNIRQMCADLNEIGANAAVALQKYYDYLNDKSVSKAL